MPDDIWFDEKLTKPLRNQPRWVQTLLALVATTGIGLFDLFTDPQLSFSSLYFIPALAVTWFGGRRAGYAVCVFSLFIWVVDVIKIGILYSRPAATSWDLLAHFALLVTFVSLLSHLATSMEREKVAVIKAFEVEIQVAQQVQMRLLPAVLPHMSGMQCAVGFRPARSVGGDYYDFIPMDENQLGLIVADVSGKGLPAALLMASLEGMVRSTAGHFVGHIEGFVSNLNQLMFSSTASNTYATLFYGVYDSARQILTFVNAGHDSPLFFAQETGR